MANKIKEGSKITDSDMQSIRSMSSASKHSGLASALTSQFGNNGTVNETSGFSKLHMKPSIEEQMQITREWWDSMNPNNEHELSLITIKRFFLKKKLANTLELAGKIIEKSLGKIDSMSYGEFYKHFCKGIFRVAL